MKISVFGLGYVGCVSAACLAQDGHMVVGVDVDQRKVKEISDGRAPFFEPELDTLLAKARSLGNLTATADENEAIGAADLALICVGTPSRRTGEIQLHAVRSVLTSIGTSLRNRSTPFVVVLRSTVLPNFVEDELVPLLERSAGRKMGDLFQFCYNPEFLREGTAIRDFYQAPFVVIGHNSMWAAQAVEQLYAKVKAPVVFTDIRTACITKYVCNAFHALKVSFANEVGQLSGCLQVEGRQVMEILCMDNKLNISPAYLKPGFAFGGSCLPKDLRALTAESRQRGLSLPLIQSILPSNRSHLQNCIDFVLETGERSIGIFGLSFKDGTDDLRDSPAVELAEALLGKGLRLTIYEPTISRETIHGTNLGFIEKTIPHIWNLLTPNISELLSKKVVVLLRNISETERISLLTMAADQTCIDLANTLGKEELSARTLSLGVSGPEASVFIPTERERLFNRLGKQCMTLPSKPASAAMRAWLFLARQDVKVTKVNIGRLRRRNQETTKPVIAPGGPVVSLTSFGERLQTVYLTIESIGIGSLLPSRLILWIQDEDSFRSRPDSLKRLEVRGLEVRLTTKYGPHTKYFPFIMSTDTFDCPLATADDDMLYSMWWLYGLAMAHKENQQLINCYRAHFMHFSNGKIKPYLNWETRKSIEPNARCFATGSSGCIYPAEFLVKLKRAGDEFLQLCPWADDVWLHVNALRAGFKIRQIAHRPLVFPMIPGTQKSGLFNKNWHRTGNDEQIRRTYTAEDLALLMFELPPDERGHPVAGGKDKLAVQSEI